MCWSLEVSLLMGTSSYAAAAYLLQRNVRWDRANGISLLTIASIQFAEALLWWDGMATKDDGTCSRTNWVATALLIPCIIRGQVLVRQAEARFKALTASIAVVACFTLVGVALFSGAWAPSAAWHYHVTAPPCSTPSAEDDSPLWGGARAPMSSAVYYLTMYMTPIAATGRFLEFAILAVTLAVAFAFETWTGKWCSFGCSLSIFYLMWSGPLLPPRRREPAKPRVTANPFLKFLNAYDSFCFGSARK